MVAGNVIGIRRRVVVASHSSMLAVVFAAVAWTAPLAAAPSPGNNGGGFRLLSRSALRWVGNRVQCMINSAGQLCGGGGSTIGGGFWPAGTNNFYIFNSGLEIAGRVDPGSTGNPWAGDITGGFFFNPRGGGNGQEVTPIYNSADPGDLANWPLAAYVPCSAAEGGIGDPNDLNSLAACSGPSDEAADLFDPSVQGRKVASENDIWFLTWEGDPTLISGRPHPLGVLVETRGMAYNTPGRNDFLFFVFTFYNVTASDPAAYAAAPARMRQYLEDAGQRFHALNGARGDSLPAGGYTIQDLFMAVGADMDVTFESAGFNYNGVNVPMALGYSYQSQFTAPPSWTFDQSIHRPPFFRATGLVGVKYLQTPETGGVEAGLTLFLGLGGSGGEFSDARNIQQLYRYLTGTNDPLQGDDVCRQGEVPLTRICYILTSIPSDTRFHQATGPMTLAPGGYGTIAVAYLFAPPVATAGCNAANACGTVRPDTPTGSLLRFTSPDSLANGVNTIDSIAGYLGYAGDRGPGNGPGDGVFNTYDLLTVPGSLLGKAQLAQAIFDRRFSQPTPPVAPGFFLIPGDRQVTVVWQPSLTETQGDPFTSIVDPNYRAFDVAGYRVYRGRRGDAGSLQLLAQFDKLGDVMYDLTGQVNSVDALGFTDCAPDLAIYTSCTAAGLSAGGVNLIDSVRVGLDGPVIQYQQLVVSGARAYAAKADTAITGGASGWPALSGTGVPFIFVDRAGACSACGVVTGQAYFYLVSAFDINSIRSGPSSLESNLSGARRVVPQGGPSNVSASGVQAPMEIVGRTGPLAATPPPTLDATTGRFSGPFPPADGAGIALAAFLPSLLPAEGEVTVRLDSLIMGQAAAPGLSELPNVFHWTAVSAASRFSFTTALAQDATDATRSATALYDAVGLDPGLAARYGGGAGYKLLGSLSQTVVGGYYLSTWGRGCVNGAPGFTPAPDQGGCDYNGPRWFDGPSPAANETRADPLAGNGQNFSPGGMDNSPVVGGIPNGGFNNAGELSGVQVINQQVSYQTMGNQWRAIEAVTGGVKRAADYNVYWSATTPGRVDSVIDVTHDVVVDSPGTRPVAGASWGILNQAAAQPSGVGQGFDQRSELSLSDFGCVEPFRSLGGGQLVTACGTGAVGDGPVYSLSSQASLGPIVHFQGTVADARSSTNTGTGFAMYVVGNLFLFQTTTLPQGVVWSLRDYVGAITGGNGYGGNDGPYRFFPVTRPFAAVGAGLRLRFTTTRTVSAATARSLGRVHTVPDPYYVTTSLEPTSDIKVIKFVNLPDRAIVRIYSSSGVLVRVLEHNSRTSGELTWDVRNRYGHLVASGVYFYHIEALDARRIGRMTVVTHERFSY